MELPDNHVLSIALTTPANVIDRDGVSEDWSGQDSAELLIMLHAVHLQSQTTVTVRMSSHAMIRTATAMLCHAGLSQ
jgi:hypothetical protein